MIKTHKAQATRILRSRAPDLEGIRLDLRGALSVPQQRPAGNRHADTDGHREQDDERQRDQESLHRIIITSSPGVP